MKFLVGFDGSNSAKAALELACTHAKAFDAAIEVVASVQGGSVVEAAEIQNAEEDLETAEKMVQDRGISVHTHLFNRGKTPGEDIVACAEEVAADTIFIGVKRRSKVGKILFGSNAQYVVIKASCPVMTVK